MTAPFALTAAPHCRPAPSARRGTILITAMWVMVVLGGLVLVFARSMTVEGTASANRLATVQAAAAERAGEQWALSLVEANSGDALTITRTPAEAVQVGAGYFWVLGFYDADDRARTYGLIDESSKLNLNTAGPQMFLALAGMSSDLVDCLMDWRDPDSVVGTEGAENDYYLSLSEPYTAKNGPLETVEELRMVKGFDRPGILWGYDANHDGVVDDRERQGYATPPNGPPAGASGTAGTLTGVGGGGNGANGSANGAGPSGLPASAANGLGAAFSAAQGASRGVAPYLTVYSAEPNTVGGKPLANVNGENLEPVRQVLRQVLPARQVNTLLPGGRRRERYLNLIDFANRLNLTPAVFAKVANQLTFTDQKLRLGLINVNTAPRAVLMCLPGLTDADADLLIAKRAGGDSATLHSIAWVAQALEKKKAELIGGMITTRSYEYSADVVGVSGDGRSYKRVRVVIDARQTPAKIIYRRDLTALGWPLEPAVRAAMRAGQAPPANTGANGGGLLGGSSASFGGAGR